MKWSQKVQIAKPTIIILTVILFIITQIILPITISIKQNTNTIYKITSAKEKNKIKQIWEIEIPKINLTATINDGIDDITLNKYESDTKIAPIIPILEIVLASDLKRIFIGESGTFSLNSFAILP